MLGTPSTPKTLKKRRTSSRLVEVGVDRMLDSGLESDLKYINSELAEKPEFAAEVARIIRDGELEKALARRQAAALQAQLGPKLHLRCKSFNGLGKKYLRSLINAWKLPDVLVPDNYEGEEPDVDIMRRKVCFALQVCSDVNIPENYTCKGYEGPLALVLTEQYQVKGRRLHGLTMDNISTYGWWAQDSGEPCKLNCAILGITVILNLSAAQVSEYTDWTLIDNEFFYLVRLVSEEGGHSILVSALVKRQHLGMTLLVDDQPFEFPEAAVAFAQLASQRGLVSASPRGARPGTSAATASSSPVAAPAGLGGALAIASMAPPATGA